MPEQTQAKVTPNWSYDEHSASVKAGMKVIATIPNHGTDSNDCESCQRGRLMAAAPALLAALNQLLGTVESRFEGLEIVALVPQDLRRDVERGRAAISLADGR